MRLRPNRLKQRAHSGREAHTFLRPSPGTRTKLNLCCPSPDVVRYLQLHICKHICRLRSLRTDKQCHKGRTLEALRTPGSHTAAEVSVLCLHSCQCSELRLQHLDFLHLHCSCCPETLGSPANLHALLPNSWTVKNWTDHLGLSPSALISLTDLKNRYEPDFMLTLPHLWTESELDRTLGRPLHPRNYLALI